MPAVAAIPAFWGAVTAASAGTAGVIGAKIASGASEKAADTQSQAASHAADLQSQAAKDALAFQQRQAAQDQSNFETTQKANYNQWLPHEQRMSSLGQLVGLSPRDIPAYVPSSNVLGSSQTAPTSGPTATGQAPSGDAVTQAILDNYKALGVAPTGPGTGPTDIAYMVKAAKESLAAGERPLSYWLGPQGRIAQELAKSSGGGGTSAKASTPASLGSYVSPMMAPPVTGNLQMPTVNYGQNAAPGSLAALIGRA